MRRLTDQQQEFCRLVAIYGVAPWQAAKEAGYQGKGREVFYRIGNRLMNNVHISARIAEIRDEYFDVEKVRRSIILEHQLTRMYDPTRVVHPVTEYNDLGVPFERIKVKDFSEWTAEDRMMCVGFDKMNRPIFKSKENATKELSRIFGLYKDNAVRDEEDTAGALAGAGLTPSFGVGSQAPDDEDDFDGAAFDELVLSEDATD